MKVSRIKNVKLPERGTPQSAGLDFFIPNDLTVSIHPGKSVLIPSGIKANIPEGYALIAFNKSGISTKKESIVGACVCDEDYQGEIHIHLMNVGSTMQTFEPGQKAAQFILVPVLYDTVEEVDEDELFAELTQRGAGGFGSTGL